jgi:hypothetical protein
MERGGRAVNYHLASQVTKATNAKQYRKSTYVRVREKGEKGVDIFSIGGPPECIARCSSKIYYWVAFYIE